MVGGGEGMGPLEETVLAVDKASLPLMMAVVTGRNQKLKTRLENAGLKTPHQIFGFVENMPQLMFAADAIVTKAGPGTISEAFIAGLPIILYSRMPGQEEGNVLFVVEKEVGVWAPEPQQVVETLRDWLNHPEIIKNMAEKSRSYAKPDAARDIAERIIQIVQQQ
jgi:1,2-diacylglycerol 3-beta-galactosyltransferase